MTNSLEVTVCGAKNLNCRKRDGPFPSAATVGPFQPVATVWVQENDQYSTQVDKKGDRCPIWNETLSIPLAGPIDKNTTLKITIFDSRPNGKEKEIGSAELNLWEVGCGKRIRRTLELKRRSWLNRGQVVVKVLIDMPDMPDTAQPDGQPAGRTKKLIKKAARVAVTTVEVAANIVGVVDSFP